MLKFVPVASMMDARVLNWPLWRCNKSDNDWRLFRDVLPDPWTLFPYSISWNSRILNFIWVSGRGGESAYVLYRLQVTIYGINKQTCRPLSSKILRARIWSRELMESKSPFQHQLRADYSHLWVPCLEPIKFKAAQISCTIRSLKERILSSSICKCKAL